MKERINIFRQHIRQPQYQQLVVEGQLRTCGEGRFHMFPFFKIFMRKSYEPLLNKKTEVVKPPKVLGS